MLEYIVPADAFVKKVSLAYVTALFVATAFASAILSLVVADVQ